MNGAREPHAPPIRFAEFVALAAALMATQAIAIDAMLPAFPTIGRALAVVDENHVQWIVTAYMTGLGASQFFWGMISDRFGRRPILLGGVAAYVAAALACASSRSFEALLAWRFVHGMSAGSVIVTRSVIRDFYSGRHMARVMSLTFVVFLMVPVLAPSVGQLILLALPWRYIFVLCGGFAALVWAWAFARLPESLHPEYRLSLTASHVVGAVRLVLGNRICVGYAAAMTVMFGSIMAYVGMVQQIFAEVFARPALMPSMFALCAAFMGVAAYTNSRIVERFGMRVISHTALLAFLLVTGAHTLVVVLGAERVWTFVALQAVTMACFSLSVSNFGAMAMEPVAAIAGIGASLQGCISTFGGALVGAFIGRGFHGSTLPLAAGALGCGLVSLVFVLFAERGRLFRPQHAAPPQRAPPASRAIAR